MLLVFEQVLNVAAKLGGKPAREPTTDHGNADGGEKGGELVTALGASGVFVHLEENDVTGGGVVIGLVEHGGKDCSNHTTEEAWDSMEAQNAASVVEVPFLAGVGL